MATDQITDLYAFAFMQQREQIVRRALGIPDGAIVTVEAPDVFVDGLPWLTRDDVRRLGYFEERPTVEGNWLSAFKFGRIEDAFPEFFTKEVAMTERPAEIVIEYVRGCHGCGQRDDPEGTIIHTATCECLVKNGGNGIVQWDLMETRYLERLDPIEGERRWQAWCDYIESLTAVGV